MDHSRASVFLLVRWDIVAWLDFKVVFRRVVVWGFL